MATYTIQVKTVPVASLSKTTQTRKKVSSFETYVPE